MSNDKLLESLIELLSTREEIEVPIELLDTNITLPFYANVGDAGMDLSANVEVLIAPQETVIVKTGIKVAIPDGYEIQVRPKSSLRLFSGSI